MHRTRQVYGVEGEAAQPSPFPYCVGSLRYLYGYNTECNEYASHYSSRNSVELVSFLFHVRNTVEL